jgi:ATP-dependent RNA helicase SUPV3L1/SUV3
LLAPLGEAGGILARAELEDVLAGLDREQRAPLNRMGIRIGTLDIFVPALIKPEPARWRVALAAAQDNGVMSALPPIGAVSTATPRDAATAHAFALAGFRALGAQMLRVDQVERLARNAHDKRSGRTAFVPDAALATSLGLMPASFAQLMLALGFRTADQGWVWKGKRTDERRKQKPSKPRPGNAFGALAALRS